MTALWTAVTKPTLLLDAPRARRNIARMADKARRSGVRFRPHFKTHQSAVIGEWFRAEGVDCITVSSVTMARYFADNGWSNITIAFPVNVRELPAIDALAGQVQLHLLVESVATVQQLAAQLTHPVDVWIEVDTGYWRSGVPWNDAGNLSAVAGAVVGGSQLALQGLLSHAGQTYGAHGAEAIVVCAAETLARLEQARAGLMADGFLGLELSVGDTPASSVLADFTGIDELRPGNFVFYDLMQLRGGSCTAADVAVAVACPVVAIHPERHELVLYGGAVHLSKEHLVRPDGSADYGAVALVTERGWNTPLAGAWLRSLSQEHGVVRAEPDTFAAVFDAVQVGDLLAVIPVHSCLTADFLKGYLTLDGEWIDMMPYSPSPI